MSASKTEGLSVCWACHEPPALLTVSFPTQDCENYITLLERRGNRLLVCGTNARKPSCWNLVRTLPMCLRSSHFLGGLQPLMARQMGDSETGIILNRISGKIGSWLENWPL